MSLWEWLGLGGSAPEPAHGAGLGEIERALTDLPPDRARYIACFAYILSRAARADHDVTEAESREMERLIGEHAGLPAPQAHLVVQIATAQGLRHGGTEDFLVTREFTRIADRDGRLALLDCVFAVTSTDRSIMTLEDNEVRRIASELKLEHSDFISVRAKYLRHMEVLRKPDPGAPS